MTTTVSAVPGRPVDLDTFTDITASPVLGVHWDDRWVVVVFAADLTTVEQTAVRRRIQSANANDEELRRRAETALQTNRDYLTIAATATAAQVRDQVAALTRQNVAVIRKLLGLLDGID